MGVNYSKYFKIVDYYIKYVIPFNNKRYFVKSNTKMVCPLHDDHDPSLSVQTHSDGSETFKCFGCGKYGDIVSLHQGVVKRWKGYSIDREDARQELCKIFGIDYKSLPSELSSQESFTEDTIESKIQRFDLSDYKEYILKGKREKKGITYFNTLMVMMINDVKGE